MKPRFLFALLPLLLFSPELSMAQQRGRGPSQPFPGQPVPAPEAPVDEKPFSLDFAGGQVEKFVTAVEAATKEPFNVIIPESARDLTIPPVRVREVTLSRLLTALSASSAEQKAMASGHTTTIPAPGGVRNVTSNIQFYSTDFRFTPTDGSGGSMVWQLTVNKPPQLPPPVLPAPISRFYQLKPNLDAGLKVEDITTVAQTAWKMMKLDAAQIPELKVHEETGILIAVGSEDGLRVLDSILRELPKSNKQTVQDSGPAPSPSPSPAPAAK